MKMLPLVAVATLAFVSSSAMADEFLMVENEKIMLNCRTDSPYAEKGASMSFEIRKGYVKVHHESPRNGN